MWLRAAPTIICLALLARAEQPTNRDTQFVQAAEARLRKYTLDERGSRSWPRCTFQALRNDPIDQFVFTLLGGRMRLQDTQKGLCDMWAAPSASHHCPCTAPPELFNGTFVEIGANDGLHMSNTWFFEKHLNWKGLCVEANPVVYRQLQHNRPACANVNALIGRTAPGAAKELPFLSLYRPDGKVKSGPSDREWETGLSGIEGPGGAHEVIRSLKNAEAFARPRGMRVERAMLPVVSFASLFEQHGIRQVDFFSVDVEGHEIDVLSTVDFSKVYIRLIVTETTDANVTALLRRNGFRDIGIEFKLKDHVFVNEGAPPADARSVGVGVGGHHGGARRPGSKWLGR